MQHTTIDQPIVSAIARRVFPGAVVLVARGPTLLHQAAYGSTMYDEPATQPVTPNTIYDIASLTKLFTATAVLRLIEAGQLDLTTPAAHYLPGARLDGVTLQHLLTHTSGLNIQLSALRHTSASELLATAYASVPALPPGSHVAYTNINSLLLGEIVARVYGAPLDRALAALVLEPLGLHETRYCPPASWRPRIAPTEIDTAWRGGLVHGSVHDESTHALGGVAGHAGLFSSAADLHRFCLAWLGETPTPLLGPALLTASRTNQTVGLTPACGLGWMLDRPNFMGRAPCGSFGHTGFTGPAVVVVPQQRLIVVVLNNRVYPQRRPPEHHAVIVQVVEAACGL